MANELTLFLAVDKCRKLVAAGEPLCRAAKSVATEFRVSPLEVAAKAARAIKASRDAKIGGWQSTPASSISQKSATG